MSRSLLLLPRRGSAALRNLPLAASVWSKFRAQGSIASLSALVRVMPHPIRRRLAAAQHWPVIASLAMAAGGDYERCHSLLSSQVASRPAFLSRAVDVLVAVHQHGAARSLVAGREATLNPTSHARLLSSEGAYSDALALLRGTPTAHALKKVIQGELDALDTRRRILGRSKPVSADSMTRSVCHVVTTALPEAVSGYTLRTQGIAQAQADSGLSVGVVTRLGFPVDRGVLSARARVRVGAVEYRRLLPLRWLPLSAGRRLDITIEQAIDLLQANPPDILHAHSKHDNAQVALAVGRRLGIPVVYEARGFLEETWRTRGGSAASERYRRSRDGETSCMLAADAVVTLSKSMAEDIISRGVPRERVHLVPNGIAASALTRSIDKASARRLLGLPEPSAIIGLAGTLNAYEGLDVLLQAASLLTDMDLTVLIVGDGPQRRELERLAHEVGVAAHFVGRVEPAKAQTYVAALDLFCLPRLPTPVTQLVPPLKPLEALAAGVPVLASDLAPLVELVEASAGGWVATAGDPHAWAARLRELLLDHEELAKVGQNGRAWVGRERTWETMSKRYAKVYSAALGVATSSEE